MAGRRFSYTISLKYMKWNILIYFWTADKDMKVNMIVVVECRKKKIPDLALIFSTT